MDQYTVTGMSCAACSARVEKAVLKVPGVSSCSVSLLTNSMGVEGSAAPEDIIRAVEEAGYGASRRDAVIGANRNRGQIGSDAEEMLKDRETPLLKRRLFSSLGFLIVLMYFSMGHMMWGWPAPTFFAKNHVAMGLLQLLLTVMIMVINQKFFISGFKSLWHRAPNMDTLVALGSGAAFVYSTYALFAMIDAMGRGDMAGAMDYMHEFYFESAALILTLITVGKMLEARSKGRTTDAIKSLMKLAPKTANIMRDGEEVEVSIDQVLKGDVFVVRPGENIPVDGVVIEGHSAVNEAALTGESIPVDKAEGDAVSAATLNQSGFLKCQATRVGEDTTISQIIQMVSDAAATKAPIAKVADKVSGVFVPAVITVAVVTTVVWLLVGQNIGFALARGISVLVISCPCALGLATPVAIMVGNGIGAKSGILFKTAVSLEETGKMDIVALDKTGTITSGEPKVTDILTADGYTEDELMEYAAALEQRSEHPLARAIMEYATEHGVKVAEVTEFTALPGNGLTAVINARLDSDGLPDGSARMSGHQLIGGSGKFVGSRVKVPADRVKKAESLAGEGKTPLFFGLGGRFLGVIAVADVIKEDSAQAVRQLQNMGIRVVMLTGDNERTARAIGRQAGVDEVIAGVLPDGKESVIRKLQEQGKVAMVGDGINDAPALTRADMGVAIGAGTDIAIDAADIVLMKSRLTDVSAAIRLSRATLKNIHQNLFWAFFYNVIGIPLAAGVWIPIFGWEMNPMFGAAAMSLSSFCVVTNALRLNLFKLHDASKDKPIRCRKTKNKEKTGSNGEENAKLDQRVVGSSVCGDAACDLSDNHNNSQTEVNVMEKAMKIEGMMCGHCEARVKKVLEKLPEVDEAIVSHEEGTAIVKLNAAIENEVLKAVVEDQDYTVVSVE